MRGVIQCVYICFIHPLQFATNSFEVTLLLSSLSRMSLVHQHLQGFRGHVVRNGEAVPIDSPSCMGSGTTSPPLCGIEELSALYMRIGCTFGFAGPNNTTYG